MPFIDICYIEVPLFKAGLTVICSDVNFLVTDS